MRMKSGFSVLEVTLAVALFAIFSVGVVVAVLSNLNANQTGQEQIIASQYTSEGMEAVRSVKNQNFSALVNGSWGLVQSGGVWTLSGVNNSWDKYTRVVTISDAQRDVSGNIVASGGTVDANTKKIVVTTSWNVNSVRPVSSVLTSYLTNWKGGIEDGLMVYGDTGNLATPRYRLFVDTNNAFGSELAAGTGFTDTLVGKTFRIKTSPTKKEAVVGYVNNSGVLRIMCFDGSTWTSAFTTTVGGNGTNDGRFDIGYEKTSGDVLVVYSTNAASNEMQYRTKSGSTDCGSANWSGFTPIEAVRTSGVVHWIRMETNPVASSNDIAVAWADSASDLSATIWTGNSFGIAEPATALETDLERAALAHDVQSYDLAYENTSGNLMIVWGLFQATGCTAGTTIATTNCIRYSRYNGSWTTPAPIPTVADPATNIDIAANRNGASNELALIAVDNSQGDVSMAYWSGSTWTGKANQDTTAQNVSSSSRRVGIAWLTAGATMRTVAVYHDAGGPTNIGWVVGNGSTFTTQTDFVPTPLFTAPQNWYDLQTDPLSPDKLIFTVSDNASDLFAKRLTMTAVPAFTWANVDSSAALENSLGQIMSQTGTFAYWQL